ncbi:putative nucleotidyltransferase substrate binding domain-containing protein [Geobacter pickeringii]|uniref:Nucleotidyltransferase n=1 Tax=Geobacter pickeringii TaxID=345632 RepID=A0A0B5BC38_9BACT|nr:putative nucleotidyltransferase substrate binding domain-containing protein [Geobacter pickeringii]AJE04293.1 hypothetical protein GPICK_13875 [Geobacter pickeringii]
MPIFLGARGEDVLSRQGTADFLARLRRDLHGRMAHLPPGEELALLEGVAGTLRDEIAFEERFYAEVGREVAAIDEAGDAEGLAVPLQRLRDMVADYFRRRGSVAACHLVCTAVTDRAAAAAFRLARPLPSVPWCLMGVGAAGRGEGTLFSLGDFLLVHGAEGDEGEAVTAFAGQGAEILCDLGLADRSGVLPSLPAWRGSMAEWRTRIATRLAEGDGDLEGLIRLADLRLVAGDASLAAGMVNLVRAMLGYHQDAVREAARRTAMMPSGFDFFGRFRVERGGAHRGEFNLGLYGVEPLVAIVRVLTVRFDIPESGTVERIRGLLQGGRIDVELAEQLLFAWHALGKFALAEEIARGGRASGMFISPSTLAVDEQEELKRGLEAVGTLQKMVYSSMAGQG